MPSGVEYESRLAVYKAQKFEELLSKGVVSKQQEPLVT